jgi:hypothetical protein
MTRVLRKNYRVGMTALVVLFGLVTPPAANAAHPRRFVVVRKLGEGGNQKAYRVTHDAPALAHLKVLKIIKPGPKGVGVIPADAARRHTMAQEAVETARLLQRSPEVRTRFGQILVPGMVLDEEITVVQPHETVVVPAKSGVVLQGKGYGTAYAALPPALQVIAEREVNAFADLAERLLPNSPITGGRLFYSRNFKGNYLYDDKTGKISATFDHISDAQRADR